MPNYQLERFFDAFEYGIGSELMTYPDGLTS
jgi:hypothetical protein